MQNTKPTDFESFRADYKTRHRNGLAKNTRYSVAKLKVCGFASQETDCFESQIVCDGKVVAVASNDGQGGPDMIQFDGANRIANDKAFEDYAKEIGFQDGDDFYSALHAQAMTQKDMLSLVKKLQKLMAPASGKLAYFTPDLKAGAYYTVKTSMTAEQYSKNPHCRPGAVFLTPKNMMAFLKHVDAKHDYTQLIASTYAKPSALSKVLMPAAPAKVPASIQPVFDNAYRVNGVGCKDIFTAEVQVKLQKQVKDGPAIRIEKGGVEIKLTSFQSMCSVERRRARAAKA